MTSDFNIQITQPLPVKIDYSRFTLSFPILVLRIALEYARKKLPIATTIGNF